MIEDKTQGHQDQDHQDQDHQDNDKPVSDLSRRDFVALSLGAGLAAAAGSASAAELPVIETNVQVKTPDGTCDAVFIHPATGSHPGVLIWPDAFGLLSRSQGARVRQPLLLQLPESG
jgi:hypothetical protein